MKTLLMIALFISTMAFGSTELNLQIDQLETNYTSSYDRPATAYIKCTKKCGASSEVFRKVSADTCARVRLMRGCYCGGLKWINSQIRKCTRVIISPL